MGLYDREYYREERSGWSLAGQHSMVNILIAINVVVFLLEVMFGGTNPNFVDQLCVHSDLFSKPWYAWQLLTAGFAHDPKGVLHILFNMFGLWMFGREVEGIYGRYEFLRLYLTLIVLTSLSWVTVQYFMAPPWPTSMLGASGAITGVIMIYVMHFPKRLLYIWGILPIPVWAFGVFFVLTDLFGLGRTPGQGEPAVAYEAHLAGALFGFLYYQSGINLGRLLPGGLKLPGSAKPKLRVHEPAEPSETFDQRLDRILAKIAESGIDSLSPEEQRLLEDASRRMQRRRN
jgi:membrane associated rhomboid family serine protease